LVFPGFTPKARFLRNIALRMIAHYFRKITAWNLAFCSFAICVVVTAHAGLIQGHTPPLIKPEQQETSSSATARKDDLP
jgi:hypothetical protein